MYSLLSCPIVLIVGIYSTVRKRHEILETGERGMDLLVITGPYSTNKESEYPPDSEDWRERHGVAGHHRRLLDKQGVGKLTRF